MEDSKKVEGLVKRFISNADEMVKDDKITTDHKISMLYGWRIGVLHIRSQYSIPDDEYRQYTSALDYFDNLAASLQ